MQRQEKRAKGALRRYTLITIRRASESLMLLPLDASCFGRQNYFSLIRQGNRTYLSAVLEGDFGPTSLFLFAITSCR